MAHSGPVRGCLALREPSVLAFGIRFRHCQADRRQLGHSIPRHPTQPAEAIQCRFLKDSSLLSAMAVNELAPERTIKRFGSSHSLK